MEHDVGLKSFGDAFSAVVIGAGGGIGAAFVRQLADTGSVRVVHALSRRRTTFEHACVQAYEVDILDEAQISRAADIIREGGGTRLVIVATGVLHSGDVLQPEKTWRALNAENLARSFAVNTIGPALLAKHLLPLLPRTGKSVFAAISARVGSISDNSLGGWYSYRASKAALNMMIKTLSIELARARPEAICLGLHPGTVDTKLSAPFQAGVPDARLFSTETSASYLLSVVENATPADTGKLLAWDGQKIPS